MSDVIKKLREELDVAQLAAREIEERLRDAIIAKCPAEIGDIVVYGGKQYRVSSFIPNSWSDECWLKGNPKNSDGSWSSRERNLFNDWKLL